MLKRKLNIRDLEVIDPPEVYHIDRHTDCPYCGEELVHTGEADGELILHHHQVWGCWALDAVECIECHSKEIEFVYGLDEVTATCESCEHTDYLAPDDVRRFTSGGH